MNRHTGSADSRDSLKRDQESIVDNKNDHNYDNKRLIELFEYEDTLGQ